MKRILVTYSGKVQGVGFRATAQKIASGFEVGGWVKNLPSSSVEMVVSGEEKEVEAFLGAVRNSRLGELIDREVQEPGGDIEANGSFEIKH